MDKTGCKRSTWLFLFLCTAFLPSGLASQQSAEEYPRPTGSVIPISGAVPIIDGLLDEEVWSLGEPITEFFQREPVEGVPVSERTEVRILSDGEALYVGAWLYDRNPDQIVLGERLRDSDVQVADHFGVIFDTYQDRQNGFVFVTTPAAIEYDAQVSDEGQSGGRNVTARRRQQSSSTGGLNLNWDGSWEVATSRNGEGWYAEFRIPFATLRYGGGSDQTWGMNMVRRIRRRNEESFWAPIPRQHNFYRLSLGGDLTGVPAPTQRSATVTPYLLSSVERNYIKAYGRKTRSTQKLPREVGMDAKITITPSLTLDLTANTDFAQVEVDEQRTNLTRFPLFFPEKRPFFLENAGTFTAGTPQAADLFFSRRIGISPGGNPVPILGGGRLTGKVRGLGVGLMQIFTDGIDPSIESGVHKNSFTVARVNKEYGSRSRVGTLFVQRRGVSDGGDYNRMYVLDSRIGLGQAWTFDTWVARTRTPGRKGRDVGLGQYAKFEVRDFEGYVRYLQVGEDFNPEVGFLNRSGYRNLMTQIMKFVRTPSIPWIRQFNPHVTYRSYWDFEGFQETGWLHFDVVAKFENGGQFGGEVNYHTEGLKKPFEVSPGVVIPVGTYDFFRNVIKFDTDPSAPFSVNTQFEYGDFFTGRRTEADVELTLRRGSSLLTSLRVVHNSVNLEEGDFTTTLVGAKFGYFFTPRIFIQSLVQYSDQADAWSANFRVGFLDTAGTGLYIVYNGAQEASSLTRFVNPLKRSFIVKYSRQLRLF